MSKIKMFSCYWMSVTSPYSTVQHLMSLFDDHLVDSCSWRVSRSASRGRSNCVAWCRPSTRYSSPSSTRVVSISCSSRNGSTRSREVKPRRRRLLGNGRRRRKTSGIRWITGKFEFLFLMRDYYFTSGKLPWIRVLFFKAGAYFVMICQLYDHLEV